MEYFLNNFTMNVAHCISGSKLIQKCPPEVVSTLLGCPNITIWFFAEWIEAFVLFNKALLSSNGIFSQQLHNECSTLYPLSLQEFSKGAMIQVSLHLQIFKKSFRWIQYFCLSLQFTDLNIEEAM